MLAPWWAFALEIFWKSAAILAAACTASLLARRTSASVRHAVWVLALGSLLLLPALQALLPIWRPAVLTRAVLSGATMSLSRARTGAPSARGIAPNRYAAPRSTQPSTERSPVPWQRAAITGWMAGAGVCLVRWRNGAKQAARLCKSAARVEHTHMAHLLAPIREAAGELGLRRPVTVLMGDDGIVPVATGLLRPAVLLPREAANWSQERLHIALLHEMAHIRRRDCVTQALAELAGALYSLNPLGWLAIRRLRIEREHASDDLVLTAGNKASDYAAHLLALAGPLESHELASAAIAMASSSHLEARLRCILNPRLDRRALNRAAGVTASAIVLCLVLPLAAMRPETGDARTVSGTVYDAAGAVVPEAALILTGSDTGMKQNTSTGADGQFTLASLPDGLYRLEVDARGFAPAIRR